MGAVPLTKFRWSVPKSGFRWVDARRKKRARKRRYLVEIDAEDPGGDPESEATDPLDDSPALFRTFADLEVSEAAILGFAHRHGALTDGESVYLSEGGTAQGHSLELWKDEIHAMQDALKLWEAVRKRQPVDVQSLIGARRDDFRTYPEYLLRVWRSQWRSVAGYARTAGSGVEQVADEAGFDDIDRALFVLQEASNSRLDANTSFGLLFDPAAVLPSDLKRPAPRPGRLEARVTPLNLLGALWLQFIDSMGDKREFRRCEECGEWLAISPRARRNHSRYCDKPCKYRAYRKRRKAWQLRSEDLGIEEIAARLKTEPARVRAWITERKGRHRAA
jgi:hypothetical protein